MSISTHVLDLTSGDPAAGVRVQLRQGERVLGTGTTDGDGRIGELLPAGHALEIAVYTLTFETGAYHRGEGRESFHPRVTIDFEITDAARHYHVPLLLSPFGYSTYRGS